MRPLRYQVWYVSKCALSSNLRSPACRLHFGFIQKPKAQTLLKFEALSCLCPRESFPTFKSPVPEQLNTSDFTLQVLTLYNFLRTMIKARLQSITFNHILQKHWPQLTTESILVWAAKRSSTRLVLFRSLNRKLWTAKTKREIEVRTECRCGKYGSS